jgi:hypothetical protein
MKQETTSPSYTATSSPPQRPKTRPEALTPPKPGQLVHNDAHRSRKGCATASRRRTGPGQTGSARYGTMRFPSPGVRGHGGRRRSPLCACRPQHAPACASRSRPAAELAAHIACGEPVSRGRCVARQGGMRLRVVPAVYSANGAARIRIGKAAWVVSQRALPAGIAAASAAQQARR